MDEPNWYYEKLDEDGKIKTVHENRNDFDGKITGKIVFGVREYFDENPEERKARGWIKHITHDPEEIAYNKQSQYLAREVRTIDEYTVEDVYHIVDKSEEQMRLSETGLAWEYGGVVIGGEL